MTPSPQTQKNHASCHSSSKISGYSDGHELDSLTNRRCQHSSSSRTCTIPSILGLYVTHNYQLGTYKCIDYSKGIKVRISGGGGKLFTSIDCNLGFSTTSATTMAQKPGHLVPKEDPFSKERGLAYLHDDCRHCDIKPENILLDEEYSPKIAESGLAKLIGRHHSRALTTMRGTVGYLAPEWFTGEAITPKADVFSYGKLLIEVISGKRNSEGLDDGLENYLPTQFANVVTKGQDLSTLLDYRLGGNADKDELIRACKVACWCIQDDEKDRPTMRQVVQILEEALDVSIPPIPQFLQLMCLECLSS